MEITKPAHRLCTGHSLPRQLLTVLLCGAGGLCVAGLGFLFFAWLLAHTDQPLYLVTPYCTVSLSLGVFFSAYCLARSGRKAALLTGLFTGLTFVLLLTAAVLMAGALRFTSAFMIRALCMLLSGLLGGLLANVHQTSAFRKRHG